MLCLFLVTLFPFLPGVVKVVIGLLSLKLFQNGILGYVTSRFGGLIVRAVIVVIAALVALVLEDFSSIIGNVATASVQALGDDVVTEVIQP